MVNTNPRRAKPRFAGKVTKITNASHKRRILKVKDYGTKIIVHSIFCSRLASSVAIILQSCILRLVKVCNNVIISLCQAD